MPDDPQQVAKTGDGEVGQHTAFQTSMAPVSRLIARSQHARRGREVVAQRMKWRARNGGSMEHDPSPGRGAASRTPEAEILMIWKTCCNGD